MNIDINLGARIKDLELSDEVKAVLLSSPLKMNKAFDIMKADTFNVFVQFLKFGKTYEEAKKIVTDLYEPFDIRPQFMPKRKLLFCQKLNADYTITAEEVEILKNCPIESIEGFSRYKKIFYELNIQTVGDFLTTETYELLPYIKGNETFRTYVSVFLNSLGYKYDKYAAAQTIRIRNAVLGDSEKLSHLEIEKILNLPIDVICTNQENVDKLKDLGVYKVKDIIHNVTQKEILKAINHNNSQRDIITEIIKKCNHRVGKKEGAWAYYNDPNMVATGKELFFAMDNDRKLEFLKSSIDNIKLTQAALGLLKNQKIVTIADILKSSPTAIKELLNRNAYAYTAVMDYLRSYGIVSKYDTHIKEKTGYFDVSQASEEERQEFYKRSIETLDISKPAIEKLKIEGRIETIGDLLKFEKLIIRKNLLKGNAVAYSRLCEELARFNVSLKNYDPNNKEHVYHEEKVKTSNVEKMTPKEREKYLDNLLADFGLKKSIVKNLSEYGIITLRDLTQANVEVLNYPNIMSSGKALRDILRNSGLTCKYNRTLGETKAVINPEDVKKMDEEQKRKFLNRKVSDLGVAKIIVEKLDKIGIHSIADILEFEKNEIREASGLRNDRIQELEKKLFAYGVFMKGSTVQSLDEVISYTERKIEPVDIKTLDEIERKKMLECDVKDMGLPSYILPKFERKGIKTIGDLQNLTLRKLYDLVRKSDKYKEINSIFNEYGIVLAYEKPRNSVASQTISDQKDQKYYMRQINHLGKYYDFIKARNPKQIAKDFEI